MRKQGKCLKTSHKQGYTYVKALEKLLCVHLRNNTAHEFWESQKDNIFGFNAPFKIYQEQTTTWKFFECYIFAIQGATMKCLAKVENFLKFVKPIKEINSILRLLKIRCLIALDRYDDCDSEIESLRKFISRHGLEGFLMNHNLYEFYCILRNLKKSGYQKNINFKSYQPEPIEDLIKMNLTSLLIVKTAEHLNSWLYNGYK
mgnify:CR=1 FL=1